MNRFLTLCCAAAAALAANAQLASLEPRTMELLPTPSTGHAERADIEIVFDSPLEGARIVRDNFAMPDKNKPSTPTALHARVFAKANASAYAKGLTITHPDFLPCVVSFEELGFAGMLTPGRTYRIHVAMPAADFVEANRAFAELDFDSASASYRRYLDSGDGRYSSLASQRLELMEQLTPQNSYLRDNAARTDRPTKIRKMKAAQELYEKTSSMKAYRIYSALRADLLPGKRSADDEGVSEIIVNTVTFNPTDRHAQMDTAMRLPDGTAHYSWLWVDLPMENVTFGHPQLYKTPARIDGKYRVYVSPGESGALTVRHPDCAPLEIKLADYGISEIAPASVYRVNLMAPPAALIEADRAFSTLDFHSAQMLYADILQNYEQYGDTTLSIVSDRLLTVNHLLDRDYRGTWDRLRLFFINRPTASRSELAAKADSLATLATELHSLKVPGMKRNIAFYRTRANEYRNSVFLHIHAAQMTKHKEIILGPDGKPEPIKERTLLLEYKMPGYKQTQKIHASPAGNFSIYMPEDVSQWLRSHPGKELEITVRNPANRKAYQVQAGKNSSLKIALDSGDRSIDAPIFLKQD